MQDSNHTYLRPDHLSQCADELRCGVDAQLDGLLVDDFANGEPESGFESLDSQYGMEVMECHTSSRLMSSLWSIMWERVCCLCS